MELIRRDTDYAFRLAAALAGVYGDQTALSAKVLAAEAQVSYALACKILQKLAHAGIAESAMGPKGGWVLAKAPELVRFTEIVEAVQGPVTVNKCLLGNFHCPLKGKCPAHPKMAALQTQIVGYLDELTLNEFVNARTERDENEYRD